jgi:hypothetical protein
VTYLIFLSTDINISWCLTCLNCRWDAIQILDDLLASFSRHHLVREQSEWQATPVSVSVSNLC